jgi:site-specific DNA-methyltransferase (adenine-specific)
MTALMGDVMDCDSQAVKVEPTIHTEKYDLYLGDCLEVMLTLEAASIDAVITDLPYGTTACKWDEIIPFEPMWAAVKRLLKPRGVFVTTASQPFTSRLIVSNLDWFKYEWIWDKRLPTGFLDANRKPLKRHENVVVFCNNGSMTYNPIKFVGEPYKKGKKALTPSYGKYKCLPSVNESGERYPTSIIDISNANRNKDAHPTQKPVALLEYLIRTYTNEGDTVLDICMGSGTTGVAAVQTGRNFIGIEKDAGYFEIAAKRIERAAAQMRMEGI